MNNKIKFIALSALASAMTFTSVASQAAVNGSVEVKFQSSITSASCEIGVINEDGSENLSNTIILPSLTTTEVGTANGVVGEAVLFSVGPKNPEDCYTAITSGAKMYDVVAAGDQVVADVLRNTYATGPQDMGVKLTLANGSSILNAPSLGNSVADADGTIIDFKSQLFHVGTNSTTEGLIGSVATITTAYY
ncbi:TPA: hypothetical protein RUZ94_003274 [Vibrio cholerae]|uniref:fimbrial protein n=2 Tax=Vibrio cholerae TaxID=666 RepID=UPI002270DC85|nr:hypothetical protein [Vibrio cholerae]MCX9515802.1 hypothetical protein [Vibrio cholerae]HDZ9500363.1 hypothetical protein [Vibrio cholerae]